MNIINQFLKSLYSPKDIAQLRSQSIGKTITYVFLLTLLSIIPTSIYSSTAIYNGTSKLDDILIYTLPDFSIQDGQLASSTNEPKTFIHNDLTILFDPTGKWSSRQLDKYPNSIGLFKDEFGYNFSGTSQTISYSLFNNSRVTKDQIMKYVETFESVLFLIIVLIICGSFIFSVGIKFIEISIFALFGLVFVNILKKHLLYRKIWRLSSYSITLAVVFLTLMDLLRITVVSSFLIYWIVTLIMLFLSIKEIPGKRS